MKSFLILFVCLLESSNSFKVRPGIVLDDPEYKPGAHKKRPLINTRPIVTAPPPHSYYGEIFDVTVHAIQGPGDESSKPGKPYIVPGEKNTRDKQNFPLFFLFCHEMIL